MLQRGEHSHPHTLNEELIQIETRHNEPVFLILLPLTRKQTINAIDPGLSSAELHGDYEKLLQETVIASA